jgi:hypothetical protein
MGTDGRRRMSAPALFYFAFKDFCSLAQRDSRHSAKFRFHDLQDRNGFLAVGR